MSKVRRFAAGAAAVAVVVGGAVAAAPSASAAAATTTAVTSLSGATYRLYDDLHGSPGLEVKGTSNGSSPDGVDIRCYYDGTSAKSLATSVPLAADGTFDTVVATSTFRNYPNSYCTILAIPSGTTPTLAQLSSFTGKNISVGDNSPSTYGSDSLSGGRTYDYFISAPQTMGYFDYDSVGSCGIDDSRLEDLSGHVAALSPFLYYCNAYLSNNDQVSTPQGSINSRGGIIVDGAQGVTAYDAEDQGNYYADAPGLTYSVAQDPATGDLVITESQPILVCPDPSYRINAAKCSTYASSGVRLDRVITQGSAGLVSSVKDTFVSTDGKAHSLSLQYEQDHQGSSGGEGFRFPWVDGAAYKQHVAGDRIGAAPSGPATIYVTRDNTLPAAFSNPQGSLTVSSAPTGVLFADGHDYYLSFTKSVPAGGSTGLTQSFAQGTSPAQVDAFATTAKQGFTSGAKLTLNALPATVGTKALTVSGTFASGANGPPSTATVGTPAGQVTVPVAADGTFSTPVVLTPGSNPISVIGTDDGGLAASASAVVSFTDPASLGLPKVSKTKTATGKVASETVTVPVRCATFAPAAGCKVALSLGLGSKPIAKKTVTVAPGDSTTVTLALSRGTLAKINSLKPGQHLGAKLSATYADPAGGTLKLSTKNVRLA